MDFGPEAPMFASMEQVPKQSAAGLCLRYLRLVVLAHDVVAPWSQS